MNRGYVGYSRSVRSQEAIENYEMPLSMIRKAEIESFLNDYEEDFNENDLKFLGKLTVAKWKYVAKEHTPRASWHHTSLYFNETDQYDLMDIANKAIEIKDEIDALYKEYRNKENEIDATFGVIEVEIWGGSRRRPRLEGHETIAGIIIGNWLYSKSNHDKDGYTNRNKINANKVVWKKEYDSYDKLVENHREYKNTKRVFNNLIKEKIK